MNWKTKLDEILPYGIVVLMLYYGCPLFMSDDGTAILFMLMVIPVGVFLCGFFCGQKKGFELLFVALAFLFFIPQYWVLLHDWSAWTYYAVMYTCFALGGMATGWAVNRMVKKFMERKMPKTGDGKGKNQ